MILKIPKPHFSGQMIEPLRTYHFARGLTISFQGLTGKLSGGKIHLLTYDVDSKDANNGIAAPIAYKTVINNIEKLTTNRLIAESGGLKSFKTSNSGQTEAILSENEHAPIRTLFLTEEEIFTEADLGELLLPQLLPLTLFDRVQADFHVRRCNLI